MVRGQRKSLKDIASPYCVAVGWAIVKCRTDRNISQERLAYKSNVNRTHITNIERGRRSVGIDIMRQIVVVGLEMEMGVFYGIADEIFHRLKDTLLKDCGTVEMHQDSSSVLS